MRDRIAEAFGEALPPELARPAAGAAPVPEANLRDEAEGALIALGYKPAEASRAVAAVTEAADEAERMLSLAKDRAQCGRD